MNQSLEEARHSEHLESVHEAIRGAIARGSPRAARRNAPGRDRSRARIASTPPNATSSGRPSIRRLTPRSSPRRRDAVRATRLAELDPESLASIAQDVDPDDAADLLQDLPGGRHRGGAHRTRRPGAVPARIRAALRRRHRRRPDEPRRRDGASRREPGDRGAIPAPARGDPREDQPAVRGGPGETGTSARYGSPIS